MRRGAPENIPRQERPPAAAAPSLAAGPVQGRLVQVPLPSRSSLIVIAASTKGSSATPYSMFPE